MLLFCFGCDSCVLDNVYAMKDGWEGVFDISDAIPCNEGMFARCGLDIWKDLFFFGWTSFRHAEAVSCLFQGLGWILGLGEGE